MSRCYHHLGRRNFHVGNVRNVSYDTYSDEGYSTQGELQLLGVAIQLFNRLGERPNASSGSLEDFEGGFCKVELLISPKVALESPGDWAGGENFPYCESSSFRQHLKLFGQPQCATCGAHGQTSASESDQVKFQHDRFAPVACRSFDSKFLRRPG